MFILPLLFPFAISISRLISRVRVMHISAIAISASINGSICLLADVRELVAYDVTSVRLVSSGYYDNSVTVAISPITDDDLLDPSSNL